MRIGSRRLLSVAALLVLFGVAPALAQPPQASSQPPRPNVDTEDQGVGIGIDFGILRNNFSGGADNLFKGKTGTLFGLWIGGNKNGTVGFVGEFNYVQKKAGAGAEEVTLNALEIPAVFHINFGSNKKNGLAGYGVVGPAFTINLKKTLKSGVTGDNFSSADVGLMLGAGIEGLRLGLEVRGIWGLKTVTDNGGGVFVDAKSRTFEVLGKFRFN